MLWLNYPVENRGSLISVPLALRVLVEQEGPTHLMVRRSGGSGEKRGHTTILHLPAINMDCSTVIGGNESSVCTFPNPRLPAMCSGIMKVIARYRGHLGGPGQRLKIPCPK